MEQLKLRPDKTMACRTHGKYTARHIFGRTWEPCKQCAANLAAKRIEGDLKASADKMARLIYANTAVAGIPARFAGASLDQYDVYDPKQGRAIALVRDYIDKVTHTDRLACNLLMCGGTGTGKGYIASCLCVNVLMSGKTVFFTTANDIFLSVTDTWGGRGRSESDVMRHLAGVDLLVIDELGVNTGSNQQYHRVLFDLVNDRYNTKSSTIFLTNLSPAHLKDNVGERVYRRIVEDCVKIPFSWDSYGEHIKKRGMKNEI